MLEGVRGLLWHFFEKPQNRNANAAHLGYTWLCFTSNKNETGEESDSSFGSFPAPQAWRAFLGGTGEDTEVAQLKGQTYQPVHTERSAGAGTDRCRREAAGPRTPAPRPLSARGGTQGADLHWRRRNIPYTALHQTLHHPRNYTH